MYDLGKFGLSDMIRCSAELRKLGADAEDIESVAEKTVSHLYENFVESDTQVRQFVLARFFLALPYSALEPALQKFASGLLGAVELPEKTPCFALLATRGDEPHWNTRAQSIGHKALPLPNEEALTSRPMLALLVHRFGLEFGDLLNPNLGQLPDITQRTYQEFHVEEAQGSPHIPDQDSFVLPHHVRSALGFGGILSKGELFAVLLFARTHITCQTAEMFKTAALSVKTAILPVASEGKVFRS